MLRPAEHIFVTDMVGLVEPTQSCTATKSYPIIDYQVAYLITSSQFGEHFIIGLNRTHSQSVR